jgi:hypothetical protein
MTFQAMTGLNLKESLIGWMTLFSRRPARLPDKLLTESSLVLGIHSALDT